jgi:HK97 family phage prohead protease
MDEYFIVCEKMESDDDAGTVVGWGSRPTVDRDKEVIESSAWNLENYLKNPVLLLCHKHDTPPVGKCLWVRSTPQGLRFKAKFAKTERGQEVYQLYKEGIMSAFSVGFKPRPGGVKDNPSDSKYKGVKRVFTDVDLLEISCVPVPAHSDALVDHVKSGGIVTKQLREELEFILEIVDKNEDALEMEFKIEVGEETIRIPVTNGESHTDHQIRTISLSKKEGIQALYCVDCKENITYLFDKSKWDLAKAKKWVADHSKSFSIDWDGVDGTVVLKSDVAEWDEDNDIVFKEASEEEGIETKANAELVGGDSISLTQLRKSIQAALRKTVKGEEIPSNPDPSVEDVYPTSYPDAGFIIYSTYDTELKQYKADYQFDVSTGETVISNSVRVTTAYVIPKEVEEFYAKMAEYEGLVDEVKTLQALTESLQALWDDAKAEKNISLYDLTCGIAEVLNPEDSERVKSVVDIHLGDFKVVYSEPTEEDEIKFYEVPFVRDAGGIIEIDISLAEEIDAEKALEQYSYVDALTSVEEKAGRVISAKNRRLIQSTVDALNELLNADNKEEANEEGEAEGKVFIEIVEKDQDFIELVDDNLIEVDEGTINEAITDAIKNLKPGVSVKEIVEEAIAKMQGKVTV